MSEPNCANPYYEEVVTALDFDRAKGTAEGLIWSDESALEFYLGKTALGNLARCYLAIEAGSPRVRQSDPTKVSGEHAGSWYIEDNEERARVREVALPELDAASEDLQRYVMHQIARIHRLTAEVCDLRHELKGCR